MNQPVASGSVKFTAENAPRSVEELALIGRFRLKDLAMSIGLGDSPEHRAALTSMKVEDLAQSVAQQLARLDAAAPTHAAVVDATAEAAPAPEAPAEEAPKRSPRTPRVAAPGVQAAAAQGTTVSLAPVLAKLEELQAQVASVQKQLTQHEAISANVAAESQFQNRLNTALSLFFAEEQLGGSRPEILESALADMPNINELIVATTGGKASKGGK